MAAGAGGGANFALAQVAAAVVGGEVGAVGAHRDAADAVREPQVEQRLLRFGREVRARPGLAAVDRVEDGLVVAHGPAVLRVDEEHRREHDARRHALRLAPGGALVIGEQHVAAFADGHQARARDRQVEQQRAAPRAARSPPACWPHRWDRAAP